MPLPPDVCAACYADIRRRARDVCLFRYAPTTAMPRRRHADAPPPPRCCSALPPATARACRRVHYGSMTPRQLRPIIRHAPAPAAAAPRRLPLFTRLSRCRRMPRATFAACAISRHMFREDFRHAHTASYAAAHACHAAFAMLAFTAAAQPPLLMHLPPLSPYLPAMPMLFMRIAAAMSAFIAVAAPSRRQPSSLRADACAAAHRDVTPPFRF